MSQREVAHVTVTYLPVLVDPSSWAVGQVQQAAVAVVPEEDLIVRRLQLQLHMTR